MLLLVHQSVRPSVHDSVFPQYHQYLLMNFCQKLVHLGQIRLDEILWSKCPTSIVLKKILDDRWSVLCVVCVYNYVWERQHCDIACYMQLAMIAFVIDYCYALMWYVCLMCAHVNIISKYLAVWSEENMLLLVLVMYVTSPFTVGIATRFSWNQKTR